VYDVCWKGVNADGLSYEEELCGCSEPRGVMLLGDSAGAHFHVPAKWLYAPSLNEVSTAPALCISCRNVENAHYCG